MPKNFYAKNELFVVQENDEFFITMDNVRVSPSISRIKIAGEDTGLPISSKKSELLDYIIEDLDRCGELALNEDHSLYFNETFCAYSFYSRLSNILASNDEETERQSIIWSLMNDLSLIQTANGPPLEPEQYRRLEPIRRESLRLFTEEQFDQLTNFVLGTYYVNCGYGNAPNSREALIEMIEEKTWEGPGDLVTDEIFSRTSIAERAIELYEKLSQIERGALWTIWGILGRQSWLIPYLFITKKISTTIFSAASLGLGDNIYSLDGFFDETPKGAHSEGFDLFEKVAVVANNIIKLGENENLSKINSLLISGENQFCEFKQTYSWDIKEKKKADYLVESCLKTVVGFINARGGSLIVGVSDTSEVTGLQEEIFKLDRNSSDKFLLRIKSNFEKKIGIKYQTFYDYELIEFRPGVPVLLVTCIPGTSPCYLNGKDFYVRTNPATSKLEGPDLVDYCSERFNK